MRTVTHTYTERRQRKQRLTETKKGASQMASTQRQRRRPVARRSSNAGTRVEPLKAWSFSRLNKYETCPRSAKYAYIDKVPEPKAPPLIRGSKIHKLGENYVKAAKPGRLPKELSQFRAEFKQLRADGGVAEQQWAFDKVWIASDWFGSDTWLRVVADAHYFEHDNDGNADTLVVIDYKTGKKKGDGAYEDQLALYATAGFCMFEVDTVRVELWFLDSGDIVEDTYKAREVPALKKRFEKRSARMLKDTTFAATPCFACNWCSFHAAKGGPCEDGRKA